MRMIWILILLVACPAFGQDPTSAVCRDNVVMVVDGSGSMAEKWTGTSDYKMDIAKKAMKAVLANVDENTQIGIVVFNGSRSTWVYELGPKDNEALLKAIDSIETGGGTPLGTNIKLGADALMGQREKQFGYGSYRMLIFTDGDATGSGEESKMNNYTPEVIARGINVDVIGVDMGKQHSLAKIVGSNYRAANNPESLKEAITAVFAEVSKKDSGGEADFELLEGLDPGLAKAMIGALTKPQNHPIGEKPPAEPSTPMSSASPSRESEPSEGFPVGKVLFGSAALVMVLIAAGKAMS